MHIHIYTGRYRHMHLHVYKDNTSTQVTAYGCMQTCRTCVCALHSLGSSGEDSHGQRRSPRPLMVVEQPMAARRSHSRRFRSHS